MNHTITETRVRSLFTDDDLTKAVMDVISPIDNSKAINETISEGAPTSPDDAIRDMFTSKMFKGTMSDKDVQVIFKKGNQWDKLYGTDKVKKAWKELVDDEYIVKKGSSWIWKG